jgi:hypothetical protein
MRERRARVDREPFAARFEKAMRAQSIRGRMALDGLYVPADSARRRAKRRRSSNGYGRAKRRRSSNGYGSRTFAPSCWRFRPGGMTTRWMRSG